MILISVIACNGHPPVESLTAEFDELGGSIGRGEGNTLILPDPERRISRIHASITFQGGRYVLHDRGSATSVQVNGRVIGQGNECPIGEGDELIIGGYTLGVTNKSVADNQATQFGIKSPVLNSSAKDDPLALFDGGSASKNPFSDLISTAAAKPSLNANQNLMSDPFASSQQKDIQHSIPSDFDPFADYAQSPSSSNERVKQSDDFDLGISSGSSNKGIDELFGLNAGVSSDPFAPGSPLADSNGLSSKGSNSVDPLEALGGVGSNRKDSQAIPQRDDVPELHGHFQPPRIISDSAAAQPVSSTSEILKPSPSDPGMVLSWDSEGDQSGDIKTMIIPARRREVEAANLSQPIESVDPLPPKMTADTSVSANAMTPDTTASRLNSSQASSTMSPKAFSDVSAAPASEDALLRAFLEGAGVSNLNIPDGLTPEKMHMIGALLRTAMQGTLDLLLARAVVKREVRAEMTMIVARENNPLKFSPNVESALTHLLAPQTHGFMPPLKAMQDAYNDLRSHQIGFMAGMRAALSGVLRRFNPEQLEERLAPKRVMDSLLPMNRKSKLWEMFEDLYGDISDEAEEDFHALFGKEFVRAYEAQIDKLEQEEKSKSSSPKL